MLSARIVERASSCEVVLLGSREGQTAQIRLGVDQLVQKAVDFSQTDSDLRRFLMQIARQGLSALNEEPYIGSPAYQHFQQIFLKFRQMDEHQNPWISDYIQATLAEKLHIESVETIHREELIHDTRSTLHKMEFVTVPGGDFKMGKEGEKVQVILSHGLDVMTTKVTQNMWEELMNSNPAHFNRRLNHPIENITWWSAVVFANRVSKKFNLRPVWDMSQIQFEGSAEEGTLEPENEELAKTQIRIDSGGGNYLPEPQSNIYLSEGLRFGTEAEREYLLRDLGRCDGEWPFDIQKEELPKYAWFGNNSDESTETVGSRMPFTFHGTQTPVYDLIGNVWEWGDDYYQDELSGGFDPRATSGSLRVARAGGWGSGAGRLASSFRGDGHPGERYWYIGSRLLRTAR